MIYRNTYFYLFNDEFIKKTARDYLHRRNSKHNTKQCDPQKRNSHAEENLQNILSRLEKMRARAHSDSALYDQSQHLSLLIQLMKYKRKHR